MSRMSSVVFALCEQVDELGYETLDQALNDGWKIDDTTLKLVKEEA